MTLTRDKLWQPDFHWGLSEKKLGVKNAEQYSFDQNDITVILVSL